tara:strand:- start:1905 stop:2912 length:1008 start_codon:yes stop_codon:yes gene_type:complete
MYLGQSLGPEKIDFEYKEFCLKDLPYDYLKEDEIMCLLDGKWNDKMNPIIEYNLNIYLENYISKYTSAFVNSKINGNLMIGINDFGEVTGIPYYCCNENEMKTFKEKITHKITKEINSKLSNSIEYDINIENLIVDPIFLENEVQPLLELYQQKNQEWTQQHKSFQRKKNKWMDEVLKYSSKLYILLNTPDIRGELIEFIENNNGDINLINELKKGQHISPPSGNDMKIAREKNEYSKLAYWLANFKDTVLDEIMLKKPVRPRLSMPQNPYMMAHRVSLMRYQFSKNKNIQYFIIKISVKTESNNNIEHIKYNDERKGWTFSKRMIHRGEPVIAS